MPRRQPIDPLDAATAARVSAELVAELRAHANPENVAGMARYGINPDGTLGVSMPTIRDLAKPYRGQHEVAMCLWASGIHEARIMAALVEDPAQVSRAQMDEWVRDVDSWDVCDQLAIKLIRRTDHAWDAATDWAAAQHSFTKRAAFSLMLTLAVHEKSEPDERFIELLGLIEREANDERNEVKKSVNWALRQIGKRNAALRERAIASAERIRDNATTRAGRWVASDALRELRGFGP